MNGHRPGLSLVPAAAPLSRRELLRIGSLGAAGLTLPHLLAADERATANNLAASADAAIVIFLNGGPSHLDMWDMKPDAPVEIRGEFSPIETTNPGVQLCEHLPRMANLMHHAALVRSMHHNVNNAHALAVYTALTGHDRGDGNVLVASGPEDHPCPGAVLTRLRPPERNIVPYVALPYKTQEGAGGPLQPGFNAGFIGQGYDPLWVTSDPNSPDFQVPSLALTAGVSADRLTARSDLLAKLELNAARRQQDSPVAAMHHFQERAISLLSSSDTQRAFRIGDEPDAVRDSYGRNIYGQSTLLARRLIEAGTRMVTLSWAPDANATWDTHGSNFKKLKGTLLPQLDAALSSLLNDLIDRGRLQRTLVVISGDFGRSPKVNNNDGGRDHWNNCYTIMLAGGGMRPGYVHGASDRTGSLPAESPVTPADIVATMYRALGIAPQTEIYDRLNRPFPVSRGGKVVRELLV